MTYLLLNYRQYILNTVGILVYGTLFYIIISPSTLLHAICDGWKVHCIQDNVISCQPRVKVIGSCRIQSCSLVTQCTACYSSPPESCLNSEIHRLAL